MAELASLLEERCDPNTVKDCDGRTLRRLCKRCKKNPERKMKLSSYTLSLLDVHSLQQAGFRFENDRFDLQFWMDLALVKRMLAPRIF